MQPILIAVGIGNTSIQLGWTATAGCPAAWLDRLDIATGSFRPEQLESRLTPDPCLWQVASVHRLSETRLATWVRQNRRHDHYHALVHHELPLRIHLEQPQQVGLDRLVAAVAANHLRQSDRPAIVVDAGTAITVDLIRADGAFLGGAILPGMRMVSRALASNTDLLPEVVPRPDDDAPVVGKSTEAAIRSGLRWGAVGATRELVQRMSHELDPSPQLFLTGGDAEPLVEHLGPDARFVPDMVLSGIVASVGKT